MSYREKQRIELVIEILNKIAVFLYVVVAFQIFAYLINLKILFINMEVRSIAIEKYAVIVCVTALLAYVFSKISAKVRDEFVKKLKYTK